jgi:hypothetical protein
MMFVDGFAVQVLVESQSNAGEILCFCVKSPSLHFKFIRAKQPIIVSELNTIEFDWHISYLE